MDPLLAVEGLSVLPFSPSEFGLYAQPLNADGSVAPHTAAEALAASGASAVLDGPMFHLCGGQSGYRTASCAKLDYLHFDPAAGLDFAGSPSTAGEGGVVIVTSSGTAEALAARERQNVRRTFDLRVGVQLYPWLVARGEPAPQSTAGSNGNAEWRAALGILRDGRMAFAVGAYSMPDFAARLARAGFVSAGYTDGGGSTRLQLADGTYRGAGEDRRVASWMTVGAGGGVSGKLLVAAAVAGVVWWWMRGRRR